MFINFPEIVSLGNFYSTPRLQKVFAISNKKEDTFCNDQITLDICNTWNKNTNQVTTLEILKQQRQQLPIAGNNLL